MGKIHKALEKSKKERQQSQKDPFGSFKSELKDRRRPIDTIEKDPGSRNFQTTADSKLGGIHALLDDTAKIKSTKGDASSSIDAVQAPSDFKPNDRKKFLDNKREIRQERQTGRPINEHKKYEQAPTVNKEKVYGQDDERVTDAAGVETQGVLTQKIVSLKSADDAKPEIQYLQDDNYSSQPAASETFQPQRQTGGSLKLHYSLVTLAKPKSFEAEQFKILRANLLFPKTGKPPQTILLTSAVPGEGKTFTAMNLAVSLAQNINSHVLLVDADIRKPEIHKRFGFREDINGLSDFLTQNIPIPSLLVKTPLSNLSILPGGQATINPSELISSDKMKKLLAELSTRYSDRFVIIDAPPPKLAAETYALARFVEHIIPVVRSGRSNRELVEEMMNLLGRDKIHGVVLNWYDIRQSKRYGYHKYSEYYSK